MSTRVSKRFEMAVAEEPKLIFSISPTASISNALKTSELIVSIHSFCEFQTRRLHPQSYFPISSAFCAINLIALNAVILAS